MGVCFGEIIWRNTTNSATAIYVTYNSTSTTNANAGGTLSGSSTTTYDSRGRVTATTEAVGSTPYTTTASYNDDNQLTSQTYPNGDVLTNRYDSSTGMANGLGLTPHGGSQVWLLSSLIYFGQAGAAGLPASASLGAITGGTASVAYTYDGLLRPSNTKYTFNSTTLYQVQPTYDPLGNVTGVTSTLPQGTDTQVFCYDAQERLTWAGSSGTPPCSSPLMPGDTVSLSGSGASYSASYAYNDANRVTSSPLGPAPTATRCAEGKERGCAERPARRALPGCIASRCVS